MKVKYEGGQVLTDVVPGLKKTKFSLMGIIFFIFCAVSGGAFGIESIIPASGPGVTLVLLIVIPLMWALPMGLYVSELTNLAPVDSGPYVWMKMAFGEFWGFVLDVYKRQQYTKPREYRGLNVPEVLVSGNHKLIALWLSLIHI